MKNKTTTYKWAYLPFVFSSAAILATQATAGPSGSQRYQDAKQVSSVNHQYVGGTSQIGFGVDDEGNLDAEFNQVLSEGANHSTGVGLWAGYDLDEKEVQGRGGQINHAWVSRDASGQASHVNKAFAAYDRNAAGHDKATIGYGQENENLFWDGRVSKGLSGGKDSRLNSNGDRVTDRAYDWGVGATVGKFLPDANARIRAGIDHEWSSKVGSGEKDARNTTLSAGIEKFFQGTGHSLSLDVAGSKNSGGFRADNHDDTDFSGRLGYKYDFGGASIYQPDRRYRRVRVEVPGQAVAPRYAQKQQYKKVPTYKTIPTYKNVPVYGNKQVRVPTKQLVKSTMELEGQTFFKLNSAKLIPSAQTRLKQIAAQIRKTGYKGSIRITGNTCGLGDARYDQILSEKRAKEVRNFLIANGFNPNHLIARGLGKGHPKYPRTPDQDFKNRRVDIEYVSQQQATKTGYKTENRRVQTGTRRVKAGERRVATGFKNVPAGMKNVMISNGRPGAPRVIWKTEAINTSPAWIKRALHNNIQHDRGVNTYTTTYGNENNQPTNTGPVATNDSTKTECGTPISINVLGNDTDADNDALTITSFTQPANGTVTRGANGQLVYTPNSTTACGIDDTFTYTISDGNGGTDTASVVVSVDPAVDDSVKATDDLASTSAGQSVTINVLNNDDSDAMIIPGSLSTPSAGGTVEIVNGQIVYTPATGFSGTDTFTYQVVDDAGNTDSATVTVTVNAPADGEVNAEDDNKSTNKNTPLTIDVLVNDDSDAVIVADSLSEPSQGGTVSVVDGKIQYTPKAGFVGVETFTYDVTDATGNTDTATVTITVVETVVIDNSVIATNDDKTTGKDTPLTIDVLANDDSDASIVAGSLSTPNKGGTVSIVDGKVLYTPKTGFEGEETFTYQVRDPAGNVASATVTVTVGDNDAPVAGDDTASTDEGTAVTIDVVDNDASNSGSGQFKVTSAGNGTNGTTSISSDGQSITYSPAAGFAGIDTFTYTITDSNGETATATVTVTVKGDAPVAGDDTASTDEGTAVTIDVVDNDASNSGSGQFKVTSAGNGTNGTTSISSDGQSITYSPAAGFAGIDTFTYTITDSNGETATATVTVTVKGDAPVAGDDTASTDEGTAVTIDVVDNDASNSGSGQFKVTSAGNGTNGTTSISSDGQSITYSPAAGFAGTDTFTYTITDSNGETATATVTVTVKADAPKAKDDEVISACSDITFDVTGNDEGDNVNIFSVNDDNLMYGTLMQIGNQITFSPSKACEDGMTRVTNFSYTIKDGNGNTDSANVKVTIEGEKVTGNNLSANDDDAFIYSGETVTLNVLDNDSGNGLITSVDRPIGGTLKVTSTTVTYTPDAGFTGSEMLKYHTKDANGYTSSATIFIEVMKGCVTGQKCN